MSYLIIHLDGIEGMSYLHNEIHGDINHAIELYRADDYIITGMLPITFFDNVVKGYRLIFEKR